MTQAGLHLSRALAQAQGAEGCVLWTGYRTKDGYGKVCRHGKGELAHRVVYELMIGEIPAGMTLDHECFNPSCVNPMHLAPAPHAVNAARQRSAVKTTCVNGHEFTPENTYLKTPRHRQGKRDCRACNREAGRRYRARRKAAAS